MNPNNLIRPPVIQQQNAPAPIVLTPEIERAISQAVHNLCILECASIVPTLVNPRIRILTDQGIDEAHQANLSDLDKVPDVVKCFREFLGDPKEFASWKKNVERVMTSYDRIKGTPKYFGILNVVRNNIIGNADTALESYNTPLYWEAISTCLTTHYADKRDLGTLEYQMFTLIQNNNSTIQEFYQEVYSHLTLILNKIACMNAGTEALQLLTKTYRDKALDTFVRGLRGDLPRLLGMREPTDLPEALHLCLKLQNQITVHYKQLAQIDSYHHLFQKETIIFNKINFSLTWHIFHKYPKDPVCSQHNNATIIEIKYLLSHHRDNTILLT